MGLIGVNPLGHPQRGQSTIEQIATGVDAASKILGLGLNAYKTFGIEKPEAEARSAYYNASANYQNAEAGALPTRYGFMEARPGQQGNAITGGRVDQNGNPVNYVPKNEDAMQNSLLRITSNTDDKAEKDAEALQKHLDVARASSRSPLGRAANNYNAAQKIQTLVQPYMGHEDQLTPQQVYELARASDNILSQSQATLGGAEHLMPKSAVGDFSSFKNYLTNQPGGANMGAWVKNMFDMSQREGGLAKNQVDAELDAVAKSSAYGRLAKTDPDRYHNILSAYRASLYTAPIAGAPTNPQSGAPSSIPKPGDIVDGHRFKGGNPGDQNNWEIAQ